MTGIVALPSAAQTDVAVVAVRRRYGDPAAAVRYVLPQQVAALRHVDRLHQIETHDILDFTGGVPRRQPDVGNDGVVRIVGIKLTECPARQRFVLAGGSETRAIESGRDFLIDDDLSNMGMGQRGRGQ